MSIATLDATSAFSLQIQKFHARPNVMPLFVLSWQFCAFEHSNVQIVAWRCVFFTILSILLFEREGVRRCCRKYFLCSS